jgi:hypothetical protein
MTRASGAKPGRHRLVPASVGQIFRLIDLGRPPRDLAP